MNGVCISYFEVIRKIKGKCMKNIIELIDLNVPEFDIYARLNIGIVVE